MGTAGEHTVAAGGAPQDPGAAVPGPELQYPGDAPARPVVQCGLSSLLPDGS